MKSAEEILRAISSVCPMFPDSTCGGGCICHADLAAIRAAQVDAAEWMREEAAKVADHRAHISRDAEDLVRRGLLYTNTPTAAATERSAALEAEYIANLVRAIKLPGDGE